MSNIRERIKYLLIVFLVIIFMPFYLLWMSPNEPILLILVVSIPFDIFVIGSFHILYNVWSEERSE